MLLAPVQCPGLPSDVSWIALLSALAAAGDTDGVLLTRLLVGQLSDEGVDVRSTDEVQKQLSFETEKQLAGCDDSGCLAEIAGALGARYVVFGQLGRLGDIDLLTLQLYDSTTGMNIARVNEQSAEGAQHFVNVMEKLASPLKSKIASGATVVVLTIQREGVTDDNGAGAVSVTSPPLGSAITLGAGAITVGVGVVLGALAIDAENRAVDASAAADAKRELDARDGLSLGSGLCVVAGGLAAAGGAAWLAVDLWGGE